MTIIIRVALPSSFRAASYHGGSSQLLILLVSAVRGAVPLRRRRSGAVSYLQLLHAAPPSGELIGSTTLHFGAVFAMSLIALPLGRNGRSQAGAEASGLDPSIL